MTMSFYRSDLWVKNTQGPAIPGAQVFVCTQPANTSPPTTPPRTTPVPWQGPNPQALIYSDAGLTPIIQPIITDGFGHANYYVLPGLYTVVVMYNGKVQEILLDQSIGNVGSSGGASVLLETNGSPNFNQNVLNLVQGTNVTLFSDNFGNTTISATGGGGLGPTLETNGVVNGSQSLLNLKDGTNIHVTQDGLGNTTINNTFTPAPIIPTLPQPTTARFAMWQAGDLSTSVIAVCDLVAAADTGASTSINAPTSTAGRSFTVSSGYGGGNVVERQYIGEDFVYTGRLTNFYTIGQVNTTATAEQYSIYGLSDVVSGNHVNTTVNRIMFYTHSTAGVFNNWQFEVGIGGGGTTTVDTGVAVAVNTRYKLSFIIASGGASVTAYINGTLVATVTTNIPTAPLGLCWSLERSAGGGTSFMNFEYMYVDNATP